MCCTHIMKHIMITSFLSEAIKNKCYHNLSFSHTYTESILSMLVSCRCTWRRIMYLPYFGIQKRPAADSSWSLNKRGVFGDSFEIIGHLKWSSFEVSWGFSFLLRPFMCPSGRVFIPSTVDF